MKRPSCRHCNSKTHKKTDAEFKAEVEERLGGEYVPLEEYRGTLTKIKFLHTKCGRTYEVTPDRLLSQGNRYRECWKENIGKDRSNIPENFLNKLKAAVGEEYVPLELYVGSLEKILFRHIPCGHEYGVCPNYIINNGNRCPKCSKASKTSHKEKSFMKFIKMVWNGKVVENYKTSRK